MSNLDAKINEHFAGFVVRKDLVKAVKGNAIVPSYVLEYLLGQYCATDDEASIQTGIETVKEILHRHYVHRNEAGLIRSNIREKGRGKVIDKVSVALNEIQTPMRPVLPTLGSRRSWWTATRSRRTRRCSFPGSGRSRTLNMTIKRRRTPSPGFSRG